MELAASGSLRTITTGCRIYSLEKNGVLIFHATPRAIMRSALL